MLSKRDLLIGKELKRDKKNPSWFNCDRIGSIQRAVCFLSLSFGMKIHGIENSLFRLVW